jgi:hypothetical protein
LCTSTDFSSVVESPLGLRTQSTSKPKGCSNPLSLLPHIKTTIRSPTFLSRARISQSTTINKRASGTTQRKSPSFARTNQIGLRPLQRALGLIWLYRYSGRWTRDLRVCCLRRGSLQRKPSKGFLFVRKNMVTACRGLGLLGNAHWISRPYSRCC